MRTSCGFFLLSCVLGIFVFCGLLSACPVGDLNGDCRVDWADVELFASQWLDAGCAGSGCADFDGNSGVNATDFAYLAQNWLQESQPVTVVINEFMAKNDGSVVDEYGDDDDWIELYNYGESAVDIGGLYITDNLATPLMWRIPDNSPSVTTIPAGGFLLIWADDESNEGPLHVSFKLGAGGEEIGLYYSSGTAIDTIIFGPQQGDESYGRLPDGADTWQVFSSPTPGASNKAEIPRIVINEIMYHPYHAENAPEIIGEEYVELYNAGNHVVDLSGWRISDGVDFTFPKISIDAWAYLVVAADVNSFAAKYPSVGNVIGGWIGHLRNSGEKIDLSDSLGVRIESVEYSDQGQWAHRELGPVDHGHRGWTWSDAHDGGGKSLELINQAVSNEYGQNWAASQIDSGTPGVVNSVNATDIAPLVLDVQHIPAIPGPDDQVTVTARVVDELVAGITVTLYYRVDASVYNEGVYPHNNPNNFTEISMSDDGVNGDGTAGDGVYTAMIPAQPDGVIMEFYVEAKDEGGLVRSFPASSLVDGMPANLANLLYQVDGAFDPDAPWIPGSQPIYYIIMTEAARAELEDIGDDGDPFFGEGVTNAQMNATFICIDGVDTMVRYQAGVRNRGNRTRVDPPNNYRVNFANDNPLNGVTALNINSKYPHLQLIGSVIFRMADIPAPDATVVQVRVNGENLAAGDYGRTYGSYVAIEAYDSDWARNHFPNDNDGNVYRCSYAKPASGGTTYADLYYKESAGQIPDPEDYLANYPKQTNGSQFDYSDLFNLIDKLNNSSITDEDFLAEVSQVVNIEKWMRYMAADALAGNREGGLYEGEGDDYAIYGGVQDPRFWLLPHDLDTLLGQGDHSYGPQWEIFGYTRVRGMRRLFDQAEIWRAYYSQYNALAETVFAPENIYPLIDQFLASWVPSSEIDSSQGMKQFVIDRLDSVLYGGYPGGGDQPQIPQQFTISGPAEIEGYSFTNQSNVNLSGTASAIDTASLTVNGIVVTDWSGEDGTWSISNVSLDPGINRVIVQTFDGPGGTGSELRREYIDVWYNDGDVAEISGTLASDTTLDAASGPWRVTGDLIVSAGVTLSIEPGTTIFFGQGARIVIQGRMVAEGTQFERIRFTREPGSSATWNGLDFSSAEDNRLSYSDMEYASGGGESINLNNARALIENVTWAGTSGTILGINSSSVIVRDCVFPSTSAQAVYGHHVLSADPYVIFENNVFGICTGQKQDVLDFSTSGADVRPQFINNIFLGGGDDALDLDGTSAYVEGNVFMNFHRNFSALDGESYAVTSGYDAGHSSNHVIVRNLFINCDNAALVKDRSWIRFENNTIIGCSGAAINFDEPQEEGIDPGIGAYLDGNIFYKTPVPLANFYVNDPTWGTTDITINRSIIGSQWHVYGQGNIDCTPTFVDPNGDYRFRPGSGGTGTGLCGLDMGAYVSSDAAICGEPGPVTYHTNATLTVGGPGVVSYKYVVSDPNGVWSEERSVETPIELSGFVNGGSYTVYVVGGNAAGVWQSEAEATASRTWTVDASYSRLGINEILAHTHGMDPDIIELYYDGPDSLDIAGMSLTDDPGNPSKFVFSSSTVSNTVMAPGEYMVLYGDLDAHLINHLGFALSADGESLYLYDKPSNGGGLVDSVTFGPQINFYSIGCVGFDNEWKLNKPTFGMSNVIQPLGDARNLKINEWFTHGLVLFTDDFVELYNPDLLPVDLSNLYLTDNPVTQPGKCLLGPLSFVDPNGYVAFVADGSNQLGHLDFKLSSNGELIGLYDSELSEIDKVIYGPQTTDVSQGRAPDGASGLDFFVLATPGAANAMPPTVTVRKIVLAPETSDKRFIVPLSADDVDAGWLSDVAFDETGWLPCTGAPGGIGYERSSGYEDLITLDVESQMYGEQTSCYVRIPFTVDAGDISDLTELILKVRYDDGFVAYLNGVEVARRNFTGTPEWDSEADGNHEADGGDFDVYIDITAFMGELKIGANILAVQAMNVSTTSSDFIISAELEGSIIESISQDDPYARAYALLDGLRITELMYNASDGSDYDYVELMNIGDTPIDVNGVRFIGGIEFAFAPVILEPGQYIVVVSSAADFHSAYGAGINVAGEYSGNLSNGGEEIVLALPVPLDAAITRFSYSDAWYPSTDGGGDSLIILDPTAHPTVWSEKECWQAGVPTPGGD